MTTDTMTPAEALAWLDSLHVTNADGALTNRKWPEAQAARAVLARCVEDAERVEWMDAQRHDEVKTSASGEPELIAHAWVVRGRCGNVRAAIDAARGGES